MTSWHRYDHAAGLWLGEGEARSLKGGEGTAQSPLPFAPVQLGSWFAGCHQGGRTLDSPALPRPKQQVYTQAPRPGARLASVLGVPVSERRPRGGKTTGASPSRVAALGLLLGHEASLGPYKTQSRVQSEAGCQAKANL